MSGLYYVLFCVALYTGQGFYLWGHEKDLAFPSSRSLLRDSIQSSKAHIYAVQESESEGERGVWRTESSFREREIER